MRNLTLGDLKLALRNLLSEKRDELRLSVIGRLYEPRLKAKLEELEAIPDAMSPGAPYAQELGEKDLEHDAWGAAIYRLCQAIDAHPGLSVSLKEAAAVAKETFVPRLDVLRAPYADEAAAAMNNRPELAKNKEALEAVAVPGGGSLYDWVRGFLGAGDDLDELLQKRATALAVSEGAATAGPLRGSAVGLLRRFRESLRDEMQDPGSELPADHEVRLFSYVDKLNGDRERARARMDRRNNASGKEEPEAPGDLGTLGRADSYGRGPDLD